uniref:Uncharacterized protein n=1 Tax=Anguilla anguilla TaxID=7936 RepID=A0A0E9UZA3_ANGAN
MRATAVRFERLLQWFVGAHTWFFPLVHRGLSEVALS